MITLRFDDVELFNQTTNEFFTVKGGTFRFEHSLKSVAKWEEKHKKPFLTNEPHTRQEMIDYFADMVLDGKFSKALLTPEHEIALNKYIAEEHTATRINYKGGKSQPGTYVSSEVLYASMAMNGVPFEADKWNLSRLMMLLGVIAVRNGNGDANKMSRSEIYEENRRLNEQRKKMFNSKG